jgi:uncharacterized membrane protein
MEKSLRFIVRTVVSGLLILIPIYLAVLLMLKAMKSVAGLVGPLARLVPDWVPAEKALSFLLVLMICFLIGVAVRTRIGRLAQELAEKSFFEKIPGYAVIRSLTHRMAGDEHENVWRPVLAEIEEALVPAFVIEEFEDGRYTVFVPSVPTPFAGTVYILEKSRVHLMEVPFTQALRVISRWGSGAKDLVVSSERFGAQGEITIPQRRHHADGREHERPSIQRT